VAQGDREWGLRSVHHTLVSAAPSSSYSAPAPAWGPSHGRHFSMNFSSVGLSHRLQLFMNCSSVGPFHVFFPWGAVLQEQRGSPQGHRSCQQTSSTGSQPPPGIPMLWRGALPGLQVGLCSPVGLHGLQGHSLPHHGLLHGLQGNLCSSAWSTSSPSFCTDFGVCRVISPTYSYASLPLLFHHSFFFILLKYVTPEALPLSLMGSALASSGSILEPAGVGSVGHRGSF